MRSGRPCSRWSATGFRRREPGFHWRSIGFRRSATGPRPSAPGCRTGCGRGFPIGCCVDVRAPSPSSPNLRCPIRCSPIRCSPIRCSWCASIVRGALLRDVRVAQAAPGGEATWTPCPCRLACCARASIPRPRSRQVHCARSAARRSRNGVGGPLKLGTKCWRPARIDNVPPVWRSVHPVG